MLLLLLTACSVIFSLQGRYADMQEAFTLDVHDPVDVAFDDVLRMLASPHVSMSSIKQALLQCHAASHHAYMRNINAKVVAACVTLSVAHIL
jgi:hypothetical protein